MILGCPVAVSHRWADAGTQWTRTQELMYIASIFIIVPWHKTGTLQKNFTWSKTNFNSTLERHIPPYTITQYTSLFSWYREKYFSSWPTLFQRPSLFCKFFRHILFRKTAKWVTEEGAFHSLSQNNNTYCSTCDRLVFQKVTLVSIFCSESGLLQWESA